MIAPLSAWFPLASSEATSRVMTYSRSTALLILLLSFTAFGESQAADNHKATETTDVSRNEKNYEQL